MTEPAQKSAAPIVRTGGILALVAALAVFAWILLTPGSDSVVQQPADDEQLHVDRASPGCDDEQPPEGASSVAPFCSIEGALAAARRGDVIALHGGTYPALELSGEERKGYVTIRPYRSERVRLAGLNFKQSSFVRVEGLRITDQVILDASRRIQLVGNDISPRGVSLRPGSREVLIERNRIHDLDYLEDQFNGGYGVLLQGGAGPIRDVIVRGNRISGIPIDGIQLTSVENLLIEGNEISQVRKVPGTDAHSDPIQMLGGSGITIRSNFIHDTSHGVLNTNETVTGLALINNLFARIDNYATQLNQISGARLVNNTYWDTGYGVVLRADTTDATVQNNIFDSFQSGRQSISHEDHNLIASGHSYGDSDIEGPPQFVNPEELDYRLAPGSPGVDAGSAEGAPGVDRRGRRRGDPPDLGSEEAG